MEQQITLYYWPCRFRGNIIRLMLRDLNIPFKDVDSYDEVSKFVLQDKNKSIPTFAPPVLQIDNFIITQSGSIAQYLARKFGLEPEGLENSALASMIFGHCNDFFYEITRGHGYYDMWDEQKWKEFKSTTYSEWLQNIEQLLGDKQYFFDNISYVDFAVFTILDGLIRDFNQADFIKQFPKLYKFQELILQRQSVQSLIAEQELKGYKFCGGIIQESIEKVFSQQQVRSGSSLKPIVREEISVQTFIQPDQEQRNIDLRQQMNQVSQVPSYSTDRTINQELLEKSGKDSTSISKLRVKQQAEIFFIQALSLSWFVEQLGELQFFIYYFMGEFYQNDRSNNYTPWMIVLIITSTFYLSTYAVLYGLVKDKDYSLIKKIKRLDQGFYITYLIIFLFQTALKAFVNISFIMLLCVIFDDPQLMIVIFYIGYKITFILTMIGIAIYTFVFDWFVNQDLHQRFEKLQLNHWLTFRFSQVIPFILYTSVGFSIWKSAYVQYFFPQIIIQFALYNILQPNLKEIKVNSSQDGQVDSIPLKIMHLSLQLYCPWNVKLLK